MIKVGLIDPSSGPFTERALTPLLRSFKVCSVLRAYWFTGSGGRDSMVRSEGEEPGPRSQRLAQVVLIGRGGIRVSLLIKKIIPSEDVLCAIMRGQRTLEFTILPYAHSAFSRWIYYDH
jgi:hypothetical protein